MTEQCWVIGLEVVIDQSPTERWRGGRGNVRRARLLGLFKWPKANRVVFPVLQACEVHQY